MQCIKEDFQEFIKNRMHSVIVDAEQNKNYHIFQILKSERCARLTELLKEINDISNRLELYKAMACYQRGLEDDVSLQNIAEMVR